MMKQFCSKACIYGLSFAGLFASSMTVVGENEQQALNIEAFLEQSQYWPPYVTMLEPIEQSGQTYQTGLQGVLIRVEGGDQALIDFGRNGILRTSVEHTNLLQQARRIESGELDKEWPNWTMMVGRGLMEPHKGSIRPITFDSLRAYDSILFIYLNKFERMEDFSVNAQQINGKLDALAEAKCFPLVVQTEPTGGNRGIGMELEASALQVAFMQAHLSQAYTATMQHALESFPHGVLTDTEGKTLVSKTVDESWTDFLNRVLEYLNRSNC